ncbi:MAG: hypothetical protein JWL63_2894 [Rhodocyclales bacterium]|nr:hypothetical protein [Rhodocyclales bacterium]
MNSPIKNAFTCALPGRRATSVSRQAKNSVGNMTAMPPHNADNAPRGPMKAQAISTLNSAVPHWSKTTFSIIWKQCCV